MSHLCQHLCIFTENTHTHTYTHTTDKHHEEWWQDASISCFILSTWLIQVTNIHGKTPKQKHVTETHTHACT